MDLGNLEIGAETIKPKLEERKKKIELKLSSPLLL